MARDVVAAGAAGAAGAGVAAAPGADLLAYLLETFLFIRDMQRAPFLKTA